MIAKMFMIFLILLSTKFTYGETYLFVSSHFAYLSEESENGEFRGIAVDIAKMITEEQGHKFRIELHPWKRAQLLVKNGEADVLMSPFKSSEREEWLNFTEIPFAKNRTYLFVRPDSSLCWQGNLTILKEKTFGIVQGWAICPKFEKAKKFLTIKETRDIDLCFKMLLTRRIDIVPTQNMEAIASFQRLGLNKEQMPKKIYPPLSINAHYFAFSKQKESELDVFKKKFDLLLKQKEKNGEIASILKKYNWPE